MNENKQKLDTAPYKGVRDFYPEDQEIQKYIFNVWRDVAMRFGYVEYNASILEPTELYKAKSGEEIINEQTYSFKDRGDRDVTMRPEMTPTVARMVAAKRRELKFPLRWFSIPNLFRYERPQRGRLREHWQLNCDIFGVAGIEAEVELISMAHKIMKNFHLKDEQFEIRMNSRIEHDPNIKKVIERLEKKDIKNVVIDTKLARGFEYYTGILFEVFDKNPENNKAIFGGGRYDNLLDIFGVELLPTVGFGMGDVRIRDTLQTYGLIPEINSNTIMSILPISSNEFEEAEIVASKMRELHGLNVSVDYSDKKIGDKIAKADKEKIFYVVVIGEEEMKTKKYKLKNLETKVEKDLNSVFVFQ